MKVEDNNKGLHQLNIDRMENYLKKKINETVTKSIESK